MGQLVEFNPAKLVVPILISPSLELDGVRDRLRAVFGPLDLESAPESFAYTDYYTAEMGARLCRIFFSFERLVDPASLADVKRTTNDIEREFADGSARRVNLDPGLMTLSRFMLATTKDHAHRIPLRDGIYAEITLLYRDGRFVPLEWTYPDYRSESYLRVLEKIRSLLRAQVS